MIGLRSLRSAGSCNRGTSTVELALVAPFFALLTLGTVDVARAVMDKLRLQQAATRAVEMASAGGIDSPAFDSIAQEAMAASGAAASQVVVDRWLECDRVRQQDFDGLCDDDEEIARYTSVSIKSEYKPWFASSLAGMGFNVSRNIEIEGQASVRLQ